MNWLTWSILLFKCGLSCRCGIFPMITTFPFRLRATLSITWDNSLVHCSIVWSSISFVPAANTVTSLAGMWRMWALIWRAVCPGYTYPVASKEPPCTSGATPRTMELPITVTVVGWAGVFGLALPGMGTVAETGGPWARVGARTGARPPVGGTSVTLASAA